MNKIKKGKILKPVRLGSWYHSDPKILKKEFDFWTKQVQDKDLVKNQVYGILGPHARILLFRSNICVRIY